MLFTEMVYRLFVAFLIGAVVGVERQKRHKLAGVRTNALVSLGSAMFCILSAAAVDEVSSTRIASQVVTGIGFLGAGVIIRDGLNVRGVNTAATLWCSAGIGVLAGSGLVIEAITGAFFILCANLLLKPIAAWIEK